MTPFHKNKYLKYYVPITYFQTIFYKKYKMTLKIFPNLNMIKIDN